MKTYPLRKHVHRILFIRLGIATLLIALVIAGFTYFLYEERLKDQVVDYGRKGVAELLRDVRTAVQERSVAPEEALRQLMENRESMAYRTGRFVAVQFFDPSLRLIAEREVGTHAGDVAARAYGRGLFAVAPEMLAELRSAIVRNVVLVVAVVFVVAAIFYPVILHLMGRLADYATSLLDTNLETVAVLGSAIAKRDSDTDAHNYRVTLYAAGIGEEIGLSAAQMRTLIKGSFLHDVGKIGIPDHILLKPGRLDEQEFSVMKTHIDKGVDIVSRSSWLKDAIGVVGDHHEKFSGGGYPRNLSGEEIPVEARIFAVADVFDALTSERPYKKPLGFEPTMDALEQGRGSHFDPRVLDAFGSISRGLYDRYAGHEGEDLRRELIGLVERYFSAGLEALRYGGATRG